MFEEEPECEECWTDFAKRAATSLQSIEHNHLGKAAIQMLSAMEKLIEDLHHCPPGLIGHHWSLLVVNDQPKALGSLGSGEHHFYIDESANMMDVPEEVKDATLESVRDCWGYMETAMLLWEEHLSSVDKDERGKRIKLFRLMFSGAVFLRNWGLWHNREQKMPKHLRAVELDDGFEFFSQVKLINQLVRAAPGMEEYHFFNMTGEWPDEKD